MDGRWSNTLLARRVFRYARILLCAGVLCGALSAATSAEAAISLVRIEGPGSTLLTRTAVTLPADAVAPTIALPDQTCPGNSIVGAVAAATSGNWTGTWSDTTGFSIDRILATNARLVDNKKWLTLVNGVLVNTPPCHAMLNDGDALTMYPACLPVTPAPSNCFAKGILDMSGPAMAGPGSPIVVTVFETVMTLDSQGSGSSQRQTSAGASLSGPENGSLTDQRYGSGQGSVTINTKGPATVTASKPGFAGDRLSTCITDGADGFCGTTLAPQNPFDPYAFCTTNGHDGYCNTPDQVAPLGHVTFPTPNFTYPKTERPRRLNGTVDFDPSQTDHVDIRLMRRWSAKVTKFKKTRVLVKKKLHGKVVRKRVTKRKAYKVTVTRCGGWNVNTSTWKVLKTCNAALAPKWKADGAEVWSYAFTSALPVGRYVLDCLAVDGAGNTDSTIEDGRNRAAFTVN